MKVINFAVVSFFSFIISSFLCNIFNKPTTIFLTSAIVISLLLIIIKIITIKKIYNFILLVLGVLFVLQTIFNIFVTVWIFSIDDYSYKKKTFVSQKFINNIGGRGLSSLEIDFFGNVLYSKLKFSEALQIKNSKNPNSHLVEVYYVDLFSNCKAVIKSKVIYR